MTCDWRGPICIVDKEPDRVVGWEIVPGENGHSRLRPRIESGTEVVIRRGCAKRQGHRGEHGWYLWQQIINRIKRTTA